MPEFSLTIHSFNQSQINYRQVTVVMMLSVLGWIFPEPLIVMDCLFHSTLSFRKMLKNFKNLLIRISVMFGFFRVEQLLKMFVFLFIKKSELRFALLIQAVQSGQVLRAIFRSFL